MSNIQTSIRITRTSWFCVLFLNVWYSTYYIFQENQCICQLIKHIRKTGDNKLCLREARTNYSWVYKGRIPLKKVKVRLFLQTLPIQLFQTRGQTCLMCPSNRGRELDMFPFYPTRLMTFQHKVIV